MEDGWVARVGDEAGRWVWLQKGNTRDPCGDGAILYLARSVDIGNHIDDKMTSPQPLATTVVLSIFLNLTTLGIS